MRQNKAQPGFSLNPIARHLALMGVLSLNFLSANVLAAGSCPKTGDTYNCSGGEISTPLFFITANINQPANVNVKPGFIARKGLTVQTLAGNVYGIVEADAFLSNSNPGGFGLASFDSAGNTNLTHRWDIYGTVEGTSGPTVINGIAQVAGGAIDIEPTRAHAVVNLFNGAIVRNISGLSSDKVLGGTNSHGLSASKTFNIHDGATLTGYATLSAKKITINNAGLWNTAGGTNEFNNLKTFGLPEDAIGVTASINNTGTIKAANAKFIGVNTFTNSGTLSLADGKAGNITTISGEYVGAGGTIEINTVLGGDDSATDKLVLENTSGTSSVLVHNQGGIGGKTVNGIKIIEVTGQSNGEFTLKQPVKFGAYQYQLFKGLPNGVGSDSELGSWFLRSSGASALTGSYLGNQQTAQNMFTHHLHTRIGKAETNGQIYRNSSSPLGWADVQYAHTKNKAMDRQISNKADTTSLLLGHDIARGTNSGQDRWVVGALLGTGYTKTKSSVSGSDSEATGKVNGYNVGVYGTWFANAEQNQGLYVDGWLQHGWFNNKVSDASTDVKYNSRNLAASVEVGYGIHLTQISTHQLVLEPQAQLIYSHFKGNDVTENGTTIKHKNASKAITRIGARVSLNGHAMEEQRTLLPFVELNLWNGRGSNTMSFGSDEVNTNTPNSRVEAKVGVQGSIAKNWQILGTLGGTWGKDKYQSYAGTIGVKHTWK